MKIKRKELSYTKVLALPKEEPIKPGIPNKALTGLIRFISKIDLKKVNFHFDTENLDKVKKEPCLILMNHSSFIDLEIASVILKDRPYNIVCTSDGFVGKKRLMKAIGCIPTKKFVPDLSLITDISTALHKNKTSVLLFPEASYSFDGTATKLPRRMGILLKKLNVQVIGILTKGAFLRDPLYNKLQKRKVDVSAKAFLLLSKEDIKEKSVEELDLILDDMFSFDHFKDQAENHIRVDEAFRADGLNRVLYKCPHCKKEGTTIGEGTTLTCTHCHSVYTLDEYGSIVSEENEFSSIPQWYAWEREEVKKEVEAGTYLLDTDVTIGVMKDYKAIYMIGKGHLTQDKNGFHLVNEDKTLDYTQSPTFCYSIYSDYFWYEIADVICIGNKDMLYYCFPEKKDVVAKARLAAEEIYKIRKKNE